MPKNIQKYPILIPDQGDLTDHTHEHPLRHFDPRNTDPQTVCCLDLDKSGSMSRHGRIDRVNQGTENLAQLLRADPIARRRVKLAGFTFGGEIRPFTPGFVPVDDFEPPTLVPRGDTPLGESLIAIAKLCHVFRTAAAAAGIECGPVQCVVVSDGLPTDPQYVLRQARQAVAAAEERAVARFHCFCLDGCDPSELNQLFLRPAMPLWANELPAFFRAVSNSMRRISRGCVSRSYDLGEDIRANLEDRSDD